MRIPIDHRAIATQNGEIYLLGGINPDKSRSEAHNKVFKLNNLQNKEQSKIILEYHSSMHRSRAAFGICYSNQFIYVAGGISNTNEFQTLNRCERMNLKTKQWEEIASLNQPCSNCSLCSFGDSQIYRIGGKVDLTNQLNSIEVLNIKENVWNIVELKTQNSFNNFQIPSSCASIQINENQIIIMGGLNFQIKTNECHLFNVKTKDLQKLDNLPYSTEINTMPVLQNAQIYIILNINIQENDIKVNKKSILNYSGQTWKTITTN